MAGSVDFGGGHRKNGSCATGTLDGIAELLDRQRELAEIAALVDAAGAGRGGVAIVEGPAGIGKTELLRKVRALGREAGFRVLAATGAEVEREIPYGIVRQLFEQPLARATAGERVELLSGAAALAGIVLDPNLAVGRSPPAGARDPGRPVAEAGSAGDDRSFRADHGLYWLCVNLAARSPLLLVVDDAHWADRASLRFLLYLARRIDELPVALLVGRRSGELGSELLDELSAIPPTTAVAPGPLSAQSTAQLTRAALGQEAEDAFCLACHAATGGNPFLLRQVLRTVADLRIRPDAAAASRVGDLGPASVSRTVLARIERRSPEAVALARAVAVLGDGPLLRQAASLACLDLGDAAEAADQLAAAGVLRAGRPLRFVHPVVRAAVYEAIPPAARAETHRRAARLLDGENASVDQVAVHLLACEPSGDSWAVGRLRQAARRAAEAGAPHSAVRHLQRALDEPPPFDERVHVLRELGEAELPVDARMAADHLRMAVALSRDPADRARACVPLLNALTWTEDVGVVVGTVTDAIESVRRHDAELALRVEGELVTALRTGIATSPLADRRLESWRDRLEGRTAAERVLLVHLAVRAALLGDDAGTVETLARRALGDGLLFAEHSPESIVPYLPLYQLMCADRALDLVEESLGTALRRAGNAGSLPGFAYASVFRSHLFRIKGRLADAESDAVQGLRATEALAHSEFQVAGVLDALVAVLLERGKLDEADAAIARHGLGGDLPDSVPARIFIASRGHLRLAQGRTREGLGDLLHLLDLEERHGPASLFLTPYRSQAAVGLMRLGEPERAAALVDDALARARRWGAAPQLSTALRHAGLVHGGDAGLLLLAEAAAVVEGSPALLSRAWAGTELGAALRRAGRRTEARQVLRDALDLSHRCGAEPLAEWAARELVLVGARPRRPALTGVESLTPGERRVCQLAAGGMTNREIAQALFVTLRTVEVHLTHAYQKLGIPSREHLPGVLSSDAGPAGGATPPGPDQPLRTA